MNLTEKHEKIIKFLKDNGARRLEVDRYSNGLQKTLFFKQQISKAIDFCFEIEEFVQGRDCYSNVTVGGEYYPLLRGASFVAVINRSNGEIIIPQGSWGLQHLNEAQRQVAGVITLEEWNARFNSALDAAIEERAKGVEGEADISTGYLYAAEHRAIDCFFFGEPEPKPETNIMQNDSNLLAFIENPQRAVANFIEAHARQIDKDIIWQRTVEAEMQVHLTEIETSPEYAGLRKAKAIREAIAGTFAQKITVHYVAENGKMLKFKMDAGALIRKPYNLGRWHYSAYAISTGAERRAFREAESVQAEVLVEKIAKIEYRGKTLWEAEKGKE